TNPDRLVVVGGPEWNSLRGLSQWTPPDDPHLALTVHYYDPFPFTHEGAQWINPTPHFGRRWGTPQDRADLVRDANAARDWAAAHDLPLQFGEFGANERLPMDQRAAWTRAVREAFEGAGGGWCVWAFAAGFRIYDPDKRRMIPEIRDALLG